MLEPDQGGILFGLGTYVIEYLLHLLDKPSFDYKAQTHLDKRQEIDEAIFSFKFNTDLLVSSHLSMRVHSKNEANFYFENTMITIKNFWK